LPERTQEVLDKASVFCSKGLWEDTVDITLEEGLFKVQSKSESGCFEEECRMRYNGEPVTFSISPLMLKDILGQTLDCTIAKNRLMFAKENWIYLTVLRNKI
jgi:hypothetical protein